MKQREVLGYLKRLGLERLRPPSAESLRTLHRAHVERITYETIGLYAGRVVPIDPAASLARIVAGWGGYCYHLNGAFSRLLPALGYQVQLHVGGVTGHNLAEPVGANGNHLALTVHNLAPDANGDRDWFVDVGLGDALHDPLPLRPGTYSQGPFTYRLEHSEPVPGGWCFRHDPMGSFARMDFDSRPALLSDFEATHKQLSTDPDSIFVRMATAQRRSAAGVDILRGCTLTTINTTGKSSRELTERDEWFEVLDRGFNLPVPGLDLEGRQVLWQRLWADHQRHQSRRQHQRQT